MTRRRLGSIGRWSVLLVLLGLLAAGAWRCRGVAPAGRSGTAAATRAGSAAAAGARGARRASSETAAAALAGTVRAEDAAPIRGAWVCAHLATPAPLGDAETVLWCVASDERGGFRIDGLDAGVYEVSAMARGFRPAGHAPSGARGQIDLGAGELRTGIDLVLARGGVEISGAVRDAFGGPIAHARIDVTDSWSPGGGSELRPLALATETDAQGRYAMWVPPGWVDVSAVADGYTMGRKFGDAPGQFDFQLIAASTLAGTVVDAAGEAMAGVRVRAVSIDPVMLIDRVARREAVSDDRGRFEIGNMDPGRYRVVARAAHGFGQSDGVRVGVAERVERLIVRVLPAHQVVGRVVVATTGATCQASTVLLVDEDQRRDAEVVRDPDGTLRADGVLPGRYTATASCDGFVSRRGYDPVVVTDRDVTGLVWEVDPGATIRGRVRSREGAPVPNAAIEAAWISGPSAGGTGDDRTSATGDYAVRGLRPGRYRVTARLRSSGALPEATGEAEVEVAGTQMVECDLVLDRRTGGIIGRVVDARGKPLAQATVGADTERTRHVVTADDGGGFRIEPVEPGGYTLWAKDGSGAALTLAAGSSDPAVVVRAGELATARLVFEPHDGAISGRVVDHRGQPVADAFVSVTLDLDASAEGIQRGDATEPELVHGDGAFRVTGLAPGTYAVHAFRKSGGEAYAWHVAPGSTVTVRLAAAASISGVARWRGAPVDHLELHLRDPSQQTAGRDDELMRSGGAFALDELPPGKYRLTAASGALQAVRDIELAEGQRVVLALELEAPVALTGRVVDLRTHQPLSGVVVTASLVGGGGVSPWTHADRSDPTGEDGRFTIRAAPRGQVSLDSELQDAATHRLSAAPRQVAIAEAGGPDAVEVGDVVVVKWAGDRTGDSGFAVDARGDGGSRVLAVSSVDAVGPAARAGIRVGDVIVAIDGVDVTGPGVEQVAVLLAGSVGSRVALTLQRGETVTVEFAP